MSTLKTAIAYESKLVKRKWLFNLFVLAALGYIIGVSLLDSMVMHRISWDKFIFVSSFPLHGFYFLNLFQSIIVAFITCDIQRKRKKAETGRFFPPGLSVTDRLFSGNSWVFLSRSW